MGRPAVKVKGQEADAQTVAANKGAMERQVAIASGVNPGYAQQAMAQNIDQNQRAAIAMAASQRGASNPALAFRQAQISNQQNQLQGAQQAALMGQQEREQADTFLANQYNSAMGRQLQQAQSNQNSQIAQNHTNMQAISGIGTAGAMMASDERVKDDIKPEKNSAKELETFVKALKPSSYEYSDSKYGTGKKVGIIAQDLEKSKIGKTLVDTAHDGTKMVDTNKAIGVIMAAMSDMNKKMDSMSKAKSGK